MGKKLDTIHMLGGGIQNKLLCKFIANATGKRVVAGPVEATSLGNALMQLTALGKIKDLKEARKVVKNSFDTVEYMPENHDAWEEAYGRFLKILDK